MSTQDYAIGRERGSTVADQWEELYNKACKRAEGLQAQRDALLAAAKAVKSLINPKTEEYGMLLRAIAACDKS